MSNKLTGLVVLTIVTVASGILQGNPTFYGGTLEEMKAAEAILSRSNLGSAQWRLIERRTFAPAVLELLESNNYLKHVYQHQESLSRVSVAVFIGSAGPMVVHTPDVCYPANDYQTYSTSRTIAFSGVGGARHELRAVTFRSNDVHQRFLRVYYGWASSDGRFRAPEFPRVAFANQRFLYRLQVAVTIPDGEEAIESDDAIEFLRDALFQSALYTNNGLFAHMAKSDG